jgi:hypothetical protein
VPVSDDTLNPGTPWWTDPLDPAPETTDPRDEEVEFAPEAVPPHVLLEGADSVTTAPGRSYPAGRLRRFLAGDGFGPNG